MLTIYFLYVTKNVRQKAMPIRTRHVHQVLLIQSNQSTMKQPNSVYLSKSILVVCILFGIYEIQLIFLALLQATEVQLLQSKSHGLRNLAPLSTNLELIHRKSIQHRSSDESD